jgi:hypothetical protein
MRLIECINVINVFGKIIIAGFLYEHKKKMRAETL